MLLVAGFSSFERGKWPCNYFPAVEAPTIAHFAFKGDAMTGGGSGGGGCMGAGLL